MNSNIKKDKQLTFMEEENIGFRPIHYLGSKLRILETISSVIDDIDPTFSRVYDLFSGSGTVSAYLGKKRPVTSVDIQEYSRILTNAVLQPFNKREFIEIKDKLKEYKDTDLKKSIKYLIEYEEISLLKAVNSDIYDICEFVEYASLLPYMNGERENISNNLKQTLKLTLKNLNELKLTDSPRLTTVRYFGGTYFSYHQAVILDELLEMSNEFSGRLRDIVLATILSTASEIVNTVGKQFAQPLKAFDSKGKPKKNLVTKIIKDRNLNVYKIFNSKLSEYFNLSKGRYNHKSICTDYTDALDNLDDDTKIVYADPPYTRYHYSRYYHVLETMALRDNPKITMIKSNDEYRMTRGLYRIDRHQSPFSIKSKSRDAFETLFKKTSEKQVDLILSYSPHDNEPKSTPRIQKINDLVVLAEKYFLKVEVISIKGIVHSKLNTIEKNFNITEDAEVLIVCRFPNKGA